MYTSIAKKKALRANYNKNGQLQFLCCYKRIASSDYICNLLAYRKVYFKHCLFSNINPTCQHPTYKNQQAILSLPISFHSVAIEFGCASSVSHIGKDKLITITCKIAKRILRIPGH